jgi:hypothetical protein
MARTNIAIRADEEAHALKISDVRELDYDYVSISQDDNHVIISRDQLASLIRELWKIKAVTP